MGGFKGDYFTGEPHRRCFGFINFICIFLFKSSVILNGNYFFEYILEFDIYYFHAFRVVDSLDIDRQEILFGP